MEKTITVRFAEQKNTSNGTQRWQITGTDNVKYSVWDAAVWKTLENSVGKTVTVDVSEKDGYFNIQKFVRLESEPKAASGRQKSVATGYELTKTASLMYVELLKLGKDITPEFVGDTIKLWYETFEQAGQENS